MARNKNHHQEVDVTLELSRFISAVNEAEAREFRRHLVETHGARWDREAKSNRWTFDLRRWLRSMVVRAVHGIKRSSQVILARLRGIS